MVTAKVGEPAGNGARRGLTALIPSPSSEANSAGSSRGADLLRPQLIRTEGAASLRPYREADQLHTKPHFYGYGDTVREDAPAGTACSEVWPVGQRTRIVRAGFGSDHPKKQAEVD